MRLEVPESEQAVPSAIGWPERLGAVVALAGVILASLPGYHVRTFQDAGSDFKTVYASATCFLAGLQAYNFPNIGNVFAANHVVPPANWYAHAPTYPPFTFALLAPLVALPMVTAVYLWMALSAAGLLFTIWSMAEMSRRVFGLGRPWRLLIIVLVASSPLVSFGLQIGNVSVMAAALCIMAIMSADTMHPSWRAAALTISLLLKPHIALWVLVGMLLSRNRPDRVLVLRTSAFFGAALACFAIWFSIHLPRGLQLHEYSGMVANEIATGCLNPRNHELLPPAAEITSLESLFGFFLGTPWMQVASGVLLLLMTGSLVYLSRVSNTHSDTRLELLGAWSTFGLLVTYHRTHDGIILFLLFPWLIARLHRRISDPAAWGFLVLGAAMTLGSFPPTFDWVSTVLGLHWLSEFLVFRQSAIATLLLMLLLLADLLHRTRQNLLASERQTRSVARMTAGYSQTTIQ